ncbi:MAG: RNA-binding protein [Desulfobulbus propionicus]|nr:MAG: RNA-binding protein [Desulfobulbus propionicus]
MTKGKDFFGKDITGVIEQACIAFQTTQDELAIEILETGSSGIFGLCKKQAHIRVTRKPRDKEEPEEAGPPRGNSSKEKAAVDTAAPKKKSRSGTGRRKGGSGQQQKSVAEPNSVSETDHAALPGEEEGAAMDGHEVAESLPAVADNQVEPEVVEIAPPDQHSLDNIQETLSQLLQHMNCPGTVTVGFVQNTVTCQITSDYEQDIIGPDGRTLDSLQYLLRKMIVQYLPDRVLLAVDVGAFRERRAKELKQKAVELASLVKEDGKTQAIPALNPSERRIVHIALQEDKAVRSRSVGDGLFKKVLIYKSGKSRKGSGRKKRGQHGNRRSGE